MVQALESLPPILETFIEFPASGPALAPVGIWGMNQWMADLFASACLFPSLYLFDIQLNKIVYILKTVSTNSIIAILDHSMIIP